jgi:hypothetical protein
MNEVGYTERTYRLKSMGPIDGKTVYAWIFDDNGEVFKGWFDSAEEAKQFMEERTKGSFVVKTQIEQ